MGYGIGLSGLMSASEAIDVTSNNISNAQTIGYKSGEYVFSDQFFRAQDPQSEDRAGMGSYRMAIRRTAAYGTVVGSQNPLDMAITGPGYFQLAKTVDGTVPTENPTKFQYTRNGQFAVDSKNRIVNENGMFLVGYPADSAGKVLSTAKSTLTLDRTPLAQVATKNSNINLNLDNRVDPATGNIFNPSVPATYSQATSQTVYDDKGAAHTLSVFYKKVSSQPLTITARTANTPVDTTFDFDPKQSINAGVKPSGEQATTIATTAVASSVAGPTEALFETTLTLMSGTANTVNSTYNLKLKDGTNLSVKQTTAAAAGIKATYTVDVDRFEVFATLDNVAVASNAAGAATTAVGVSGTLEQTSLGTIGFVAGKNLDSLSRDAFGKPQFVTQMKIDASGGKGSTFGQTLNGGIVQFTLDNTDMTGYTSAGQTYANNQDGSATSQLVSYNIDSSGNLTAQYDNGKSKIKGQVLLAYFNNVEGLIPNGNNTFEASSASGDPLLSFPGDGTLGQVRSRSLEQSNVDLTSELVKLMVLQRQYSAVSQATKVMAATLIDDSINIGR
ncbi:flagellar hook-basal body complex protein [Polynucleobacter sp. MWH-Aus1W21]|uniref:flagellar hook-basal body complex protein n=1 Tax=Polynucleobacter sp. MWH-Aus1W21 TaxID=1855880 RepID=UPI001BFD7D24|nr:flagellar hook-basal body complex protein [Polynucleobacter sp. MWH-Aus1W21]QWD65747.1 flagellar hook-basal body complex protein [Polynucleobacter sp. MWH-Aus1W21]